MPNLNEFLNKKESVVNSNLEELHGLRPCSQCDEDVAGALWDPSEYIMRWTCSQGHKTEYRVG